MAMERTPGDRIRRRSAWLAAVGVATTLAALLPFTPLGPTASAEDQLATQTTSDEVRLVVDDPGAALMAAQDPDVDLARLTPELGVITTSPENVEDAAEAALSAGATTVEPDVEVELASFIPTDPGWTAWWGARQLRLEDAWPTTLGSGAVDIAIVDTGINLVPELAGRVLPGWSAFADQPSTLDGSSSLHGTKAAMVAAGAVNNGTGASGACPQCDVIPLKVFRAGSNTANLSDVATAITWATSNGAEIINLSLAGPQTLTTLTNAVAAARAAGIVVVAAAGNNGFNSDCSNPIASPCITTPNYPASTPGVIGVAGRDQWSGLAGGSSRGPNVDLAAAYTNVVASTTFGSFVTYSGTSSASPLVAGTIGLFRTIDPTATPAQIDFYLQISSPMPNPTINVAWGELNAVTFLALANASWPPAPFTDVVRPSFYATAVDWGWNEGVVNGTSPTRFSPDETISRAMGITFLWRLAGSPAPTIANPFVDVPTGAYFRNAAIWGFEEGITNGQGGANTFDPDGVFNRSQAMTMIWRFNGAAAPSGANPFIDVSSTAWYVDAVTWGYEQGITNGIGGSNVFAPELPIPRSQDVTMLWRSVGSPTAP